MNFNFPSRLYLYLGWNRSKRFLMKKESISAKPKPNVVNFKQTILTDLIDFEEYWTTVNPPHKCKVQFTIDTSFLQYDMFITNYTFNSKIYRNGIHKRFWSGAMWNGNIMKKLEYTHHVLYMGEIPSEAIISHKRFGTEKSLYGGHVSTRELTYKGR